MCVMCDFFTIQLSIGIYIIIRDNLLLLFGLNCTSLKQGVNILQFQEDREHFEQTLWNKRLKEISFDLLLVSFVYDYVNIRFSRRNISLLKSWIFFLFSLLNFNLPTDTLQTFNFSKVHHLFCTRGKSLGLLSLSSNANTSKFGLKSLTRLSIKQWNKLKIPIPYH